MDCKYGVVSQSKAHDKLEPEMRILRFVFVASLCILSLLITNRSPGVPTPNEDKGTQWPMFGGSTARNMASPSERGIVDKWSIVKNEQKNIKWTADLGKQTYSSPVIAEGRVFIGTNNLNPRNPRDRGKPSDDDPLGPPLDKGVLMCFDARTGEFLWQAVHDKLPSGPINDWPHFGITSTPTVENGRVYYVNNRGEVICADINGFRDGKNDGVQDEKYTDKTDADIIWRYDMIAELKVFPHWRSHCSPHSAAHCSPLIVGDRLFVNTGNGVDEAHLNLPAPDAPSFACLDKKTGKLLWSSNLPGKGIMHGQWSSPAYGVIKNVPQVIFPAGDGWIYALDPKTGELIWKFDANPKGAKFSITGNGEKCEFLAMPVIYQERVYIGTGQDPENFEGPAHFWCIDPAGKTGDISPELVTDAKADPPKTKPNPNSGGVWQHGGHDNRPRARRPYFFGRTLSTACIVDDIVYLAELSGYVHCLNARTGEVYWILDVQSSVWGSPFYADGKVLVGSADGEIYVLKHDIKPVKLNSFDEAAKQEDNKSANLVFRAIQKQLREKVVLATIDMEEPINSTPTAAGGVLYVATGKKLYAIGGKK